MKKAVSGRCAARIHKEGINPCVDIPLRISNIFGKRGYVPMRGTLNGRPIRATLVPMGQGRHRLFINGEMRKAARVDVGDSVELVLEIDPEPRTVSMPEAFRKALEENPKAGAAFRRLTPSRQKEFQVYMNSLKRPETLARVVKRAVAGLQKKPE